MSKRLPNGASARQLKIAVDDLTVAFDLLWQFIEIAPSIYERVDDSSGDVGDVFRGAGGSCVERHPR